MTDVKCVTCGRNVQRNHCWPCMAEENAMLRRKLEAIIELAREWLTYASIDEALAKCDNG